MAGQTETRGALRVLILFSLLSLTEVFELHDEWKELSPDIAALHRLRGLPEHMSHQSIRSPSDFCFSALATASSSTSADIYTVYNAYAQYDRYGHSRVDTDQKPMSLLDGFQECDNFTTCVIQKEQEFDNFLAHIDKQKIQDWLLTASEISHSYSRKLLVMTDEEKSTHDRVRQDYNMDPHYSVIVSKACLHNDSCLPEADSYTVVKIFGSVSEDGQTVYGYSGSSLAELILKPSLESAPVFSLDGDTTTAFQHDFIRGFMLHGIKAVLETSQGDQQVYQVMNQINQTDLVSRYRMPKRPVDHTTQYDNQQILIMEDDPVVRKAAAYLYEKHPAVSSVYVLDEHQNPKLIHGDSVPLSEDSRLVLVGHGTRDDTGKVRLAGYNAKDVAEIIGRTFRVGDQIKTTSVVACEVGSDKEFIETLLREIHETAHIETELHLRDTVLQVSHTGEKITQEITPTGLEWRHKDDSKKVVATLDRNGDVVIRNQPGNKGEPIFTNERNFLVNQRQKKNRFLEYRKNWPNDPRTFIDSDVFKTFNQNEAADIKNACDELEALTWGIFHSDRPHPRRIDINNLQQIGNEFVIGEKEQSGNIKWIVDDHQLRDVLSNCYEITSGKDVLNVIRHYAKTGENKPTYLMVNDWIYVVDPQNLYVYPVGKKLDNNQIQSEDKISEVKDCIIEQIDKHKYSDIRENVLINNVENAKESYVQYVKDTFLGEHTTHPSLSTEAWYNTYFTASIISESARNFRTFPLVLMALDMVQSTDNNIREKGLNLFFDNHPMAKGNTWIDPSRRGFSGSSTPKGSSKLNNYNNPRSLRQLMKDLQNLIRAEVEMFKSWSETNNDVVSRISDIAVQNGVFEANSLEQSNFERDHDNLKKNIQQQPTSSGNNEQTPTSGTLGGSDDGDVTLRDLNSASESENSFKLASYYSRASASFAEEIHSQLKAKYGDNLAGIHLKEGSARMENGQFICQLISEDVNVEPAEFRVDLAPEGQQYNEKMLKSIEATVHDLEMQGSLSSHQVNKHVEHAGTAVGALGLMLGMKGAVHAFEQGDIKDGVIASLQTVHGVTGMTMAFVAKQALSSETRVAKAVVSVMESPAMKAGMKVIPIVGIGFGIYNIEQDLERGDTLGVIDAGLDIGMVELDVIEMVQPELAPFIAPITLALSVVRMTIDDIYMGIQNELQSLPKDAGVLDKIQAFFVGFGKGLFHFAIHVASIFYDWHYEEIEEGHRLVAQISDYHKYYTVTKEQDGTSAIDFSGGDSSWNGGSISFCLADQGQSEFCMDYFVSSDESFGKRCWNIDTQGSKDIILGLGESHQLEYKTLQKKVLMFIPAGSVTVVSGYEAVSYSRYGTYKGDRESNRFFAVQKAEDKHVIEIMLSYYYQLYGEPGDDTFFLGPQKSYVEGSGGKDTYIIPDKGGKTIINNYDPAKSPDTLHFSVDYSQISVSKSGNDVVLRYEDSHTVTIQNCFLGELYRHMNMMSGDGVLFEISSMVISSVKLVARGINKMSTNHGGTVDASQPLLRTVTNIFGSPYDDTLIGNGDKNLMDGGGGRDRLIGGEGEDIYMVKDRNKSLVLIENYSRDNETDLAIIEANLHTFKVRVEDDDLILKPFYDDTVDDCEVTLVNWFRSEADRHLLVITKDLVTFAISDNKADCIETDPFTKCIRSHSIDYSSSPSALVVDLEKDEAFHSVTEVRGSKLNDVIQGNKERNTIVPGGGSDFLQGRGGGDWYVVTPGQGIKTINNQSPDLATDVLFLKEQYQYITCSCEGQHVILSVNGTKDVVLQDWFYSRRNQHLQIQTSDGITFELMSNISSCGGSLKLPVTVDYRNQEPRLLDSLQIQQQTCSFDSEETKSAKKEEEDNFHKFDKCFRYRSRESEMVFCGLQGLAMMMNHADSVIEMYGSSGFDIMVGNSKGNLLDPYTGGALMVGGEGKDTYTVKHGYGNDMMIDNFAEDQNLDTVLVDMDFLSGGQITLDGDKEHLGVTITTKGDNFTFSLLNYNYGPKYQHLNFQSSDGVNFNLKFLNTTRGVPLLQIEAFKVTLTNTQTQVDCRLDLNSQRNLSKVHTVQGCPSQSNHILGNDEDNALIGGWKDDALEGGEGNDTLIGGNGNDILIGGLGDDTLHGEDGNDTMMGNSGRDVFIPGPGADLVDGGPGRDTVVYQGDHDKGEGVYVNLLSGECRQADAEGDVLKDVETVIGTIYSDILVSGYEAALLKGSDGNDILVSTGGDYLIGGDGNDIYMLAFHQGSVTIDNCAKDNATDVLYLRPGSSPVFECQLLSDRVLLTFHGLNQTTSKIMLQGWVSDEDECGHLMLVYREVEVSVDRLLDECQLRQRAIFWSSVHQVIIWVVGVSLVLFGIFMLLMCRQIIRRVRH